MTDKPLKAELGWICPRCSRIWSPRHEGCNACNEAVTVAAALGFAFESAEDAVPPPPDPGKVENLAERRELAGGPFRSGKLGDDDPG